MNALPTAAPKAYFVAYDIFGYLLPAALLVTAIGVGNDFVGSVIVRQLAESSGVVLFGFVLGIYMVGHIIAAASAYFLERLVLVRRLGYPTSHMFGSTARPQTWWRKLSGPSYENAYSAEFVARFDRAFQDTFGMAPTDDHDRFWLCWSYVSLHHPAAYQRGSHFLSLYGFARNIAMSFIVIALVPLVPPWRGLAFGVVWVTSAALAAAIMFASYTRLFRRLNDETYRGFVAINALQPSRGYARGPNEGATASQ